MKIETKKQEFQPVVITLETQEEVDQMFALVNIFGFKCDYDTTIDLFNSLTPESYYDFDEESMSFTKCN